MYEYKFKVNRVIDGDTVDGIIDLGFGVHLHERVRLAGINAPETRLQKKIKNLKKRKSEKELGLKAKARLKELITEGQRQPEGLYIETFLVRTLEVKYFIFVNIFLFIKFFNKKL